MHFNINMTMNMIFFDPPLIEDIFSYTFFGVLHVCRTKITFPDYASECDVLTKDKCISSFLELYGINIF